MREHETSNHGKQTGRFVHFAARAAHWVGKPMAFLIACVALVVWALFGPASRYSDTWQLVINTGTTIVTFLMVFLIQNTQNRDALAIHLKLDELIRAVKGARTALVNLEELSDEELEALHAEFQRLQERKRRPLPAKHIVEREQNRRKPR
jgi:low affinity Fe/Cu permease